MHYRFACDLAKRRKEGNRREKRRKRGERDLARAACSERIKNAGSWRLPKHQFADGTYGGLAIAAASPCRPRNSVECRLFDLRRLSHLGGKPACIPCVYGIVCDTCGCVCGAVIISATAAIRAVARHRDPGSRRKSRRLGDVVFDAAGHLRAWANKLRDTLLCHLTPKQETGRRTRAIS